MFKKYYLLGSITLFFLSGCTGLPINSNEYPDRKTISIYDQEIINHVIAIGKNGELRHPLTGEKLPLSRINNNRPITANEYLANIVDKIKHSNKKLLIYIHGGLNNEGAALKRALKNYQAILDNGQYPVFINWNSEGLRSYGSHLGEIRQGEISKTAWMSSPLYFLTDVGDSLITAPKAWFVTGEHMTDSLNKKRVMTEFDLQVASHNAKVAVTKGDEKSNFFRHLQWAFTSPVKVVTTPFAYTLAKPAWDIMLRRTNTLFYTPGDLEKKEVTANKKNKLNTISEEKADFRIKLKSGNGALYRFLSALEKGLKKDGKTSKVKITLIGHSMGAIVVNDIVHLGLDLTYENIVHMASADSIENLFNKVIPYIDCSLKKTCNNIDVNFYSLYLHPDNENRETSGWGTIPSGSLLTWIDTMYTVPKTVLDKRSGRWDNMVRAIDLIPPVSGGTGNQSDIKGQMQFTIFNLEEKKEYCQDQLIEMEICKTTQNCKGYELYSTAQEHGDFDELPFWLPEVWKGTHQAARGNCKELK
ncbi:hypothetical protein VU04_08855 [Desulfobulbus sp. TB]|nr:hypothetical protein [Desulfobulbus sp. TB]